MDKTNPIQLTAPQERTRLRMPLYCDSSTACDNVNDPNGWFAAKFPDAAAKYGAAFLETKYQDEELLVRTIPVMLNEDFFASSLGGDRRLGHHVVYYRPENTFYFYDYREDAYCPTTEAKLQMLVSNYLVRCAQDMGSLVDISNLMVEFRKTRILQSIVDKAKALLAADDQFFSKNTGNKRIIRGEIVDPNQEPLPKIFVFQALALHPDAAVTVTDCFQQYRQFCRSKGLNALERSEFKTIVAEVIREEFDLKLRHDVPGLNGKAQEGWKGLNLRFGTPIEEISGVI
jgi:hypothetical protein